MASTNGWTPTEKRILDVLADGLPHHRNELMALLNDDLAETTALNAHITNIRVKLPGHRLIVCTLRNRQIHYIQVRKLRRE